MPASKSVSLLSDASSTQVEAGFGFHENFYFQSVQDFIVAKAGGGIAGATLLNAMLCRVSTVASPNDSVLLPPAWQGLSFAVLNATTNPMQVFAQGADTINDTVAGATGVSQMAKSLVWYTCHSDGNWVANGIGAGYAGANQTWSTQTALTASATQTQAAGTPITAMSAQITTCAVAGNAVTLMPAIAGMEITILNNGANACNVFPASQAGGGVAGGDKINAGAQNAAFSLATATPTVFFCFSTGVWTTK